MKFKEFKELVYSDFCYAKGTSRGIKGFILTTFFNPKFQIIFNYRLSFFLERSSFGFLNIFTKYINLIVFSSEIAPTASIGRNFKAPHPIGIVIGSGVVIGDNVTVYQHVTIGGKNIGEGEYPILRDNTVVFANATVLGKIEIAENVTIGANSLVIYNCLEKGMVYAGIPAKKV